jgi:Zn-dependent peptidase ImmA (M78 family)
VADGNPGFYRFTVAEELGHVRLHRAVLRGLRTVGDAVALQASEDYQYMDRNAKWFASALLMPREPLVRDVRQLYASLVKQFGFGQPELFMQSFVIRLSQRYVVNVPPMRYRLERWPVEMLRVIQRALQEEVPSLPE